MRTALVLVGAMALGACGGPKAGDGSQTLPSATAGTANTPSADLHAIQLALPQGWSRDVVEAGTFSVEFKVVGMSGSMPLVFRYGYEPASAPAERESYKKYLADNKLLDVSTDEQRGAAWYFEGTDSAGRPAFRTLVNVDGKRLFCEGELYTNARPIPAAYAEVVRDAKQICETLKL